MPKHNKTPDAWDDDWEAQADRADQNEEPTPEPEIALTRKERLARHAEMQRKLWQEAEAPEEANFLSASNPVPLATAFKPAIKLLSRKPQPQMIAKRDPVTGLQQLALQDDDGEDDEEKKDQPTVEEIRLRQQREREEKQRRYNEARAKIFGDSNPPSGSSSPGAVTPPSQPADGRQGQRGRGGRGARGGGGQRNDGRNDSSNRQDADQSRRQPTAQQPGARELYDPGYSSKPGFSLQRRSGESSPQPGRSTTPREEQPIRAPRGPEGSGRGGFGFARRGGANEG